MEQSQTRSSTRSTKGKTPERYGHTKTALIAATLWSDVAETTVPCTFEEAINHPHYETEWRQAIDEEYRSLTKNGVWELVELPRGANLVTNKWVFAIKHNANGDIIRFKARLVARGFSQTYGLDYFDTYAPVAKLTTYRTIFALAALEQWEVHGMDVITAFLLGSLKEDIYMAQPKGFEKGKLVCKLQKSLYGLKQAARIWNDKLHAFLIKIGFKRSTADYCLYINAEMGIMIVTWVDDLLVVGKGSEIASVKVMLMKEFEMKDLGPIQYFLGMKISCDSSNGSITINQANYVQQILERFGMAASKAVPTPITQGTRLVSMNVDEPAESEEYQAIIGSVMYLMLCTRPDLTYSIQQLSQFCSEPSEIHLQTAKRVLRYMQGTATLGPKYTKDNDEAMKGYSDSDYAAGEGRKSISGYVFTLGGSPVSWQAKKQSTVAQSTVESEFNALTQAVKEAIWLQRLLKDLGMSKYAPKTIYCDNQGAISLAKNPTQHAKTKHMDVQLEFVRDHVEKGTVTVEYCPTDVMPADLMTKALGKERHRKLIAMLGLEETATAASRVGVS